MTTFDPGASVVFTQGLRLSPRSTAFFANSASADHHRRVRGVGARSDRRDRHSTVVERERRSVREGDRHRLAADARCSAVGIAWVFRCRHSVIAGGSDAGKLSAIDSSTGPRTDASASPST